MTKQRRYFGTDGIRGEVGIPPITPDYVLKLGWAVGQVLAKAGHSRVLIGKDTRISGYMFESALQAGLSAAGVDIYLLGPMPTPAIAYLTRTFHGQAGIVISASHNPYHDNGIKFFSAEGTKLPDEIEFEIESMMEQPLKTVDSTLLGKAHRISDAAGRYIEYCKSTVDTSTDLSNLKIVVDCANGATYQIAPKVLKELGAEVIETGVEPDGFNINFDCGSTRPKLLQQAVQDSQADLGIALDGDGDRLIMVDHTGELVEGDAILYILVQAQLAQRKKCESVVGTLMTNLGLEKSLAELGIELHRTKVGDRYVMEKLKETGATLGGENSGHIICLDKTSTGDGIIAALQVLAYLQKENLTLHASTRSLKKYPQELINVKLKGAVDVQNDPVIQAAQTQAEQALGNKGRVLLRPSGTEPVIRVMVEGQDASLTKNLAAELANVISEVVN